MFLTKYDKHITWYQHGAAKNVCNFLNYHFLNLNLPKKSRDCEIVRPLKFYLLID